MESMRLNQSGMGLIPVIMASALLAVVAVGVMGLYESLARSSGRSDVRAEIESLTKYVQAIMQQPAWCAGSMLTAAGTPIVYPVGAKAPPYNPVTNTPAAVPIDRIVANGQIIAQTVPATGPWVNQRYRVRYIGLRPPTAAELMVMNDRGEGHIWQMDPAPALTGRLLATRQAKLAMRIETRDAGASVSMEKTADVTVAVDPGTNQVVACKTEGDQRPRNFRCSENRLYGGRGTDCPRPALTSKCKPVYYIGGYDAFGTPMCMCTIVCSRSYP